MSEKNKELVKRYYKEAMGGLSGIEEVVAADFVDHHLAVAIAAALVPPLAVVGLAMTLGVVAGRLTAG